MSTVDRTVLCTFIDAQSAAKPLLTVTEFEVYSRAITELVEAGAIIICASPPAGTDLRFHRCMLPRNREIRGQRDEVDIICVFRSIGILVECKDSLARSRTSRNALGETDFEKLRRLINTRTAAVLALELSHAPGSDALRDAATLRAAIIVGESDLVVEERGVDVFGCGQPRALASAIQLTYMI